MNAGALDTRITIQSKNASIDGYGGEVITWTNERTVWAQAEPWRLRERISMRRQSGDALVSFMVRYPVDISLDKRVLVGDVAYSVIEIDASRKRNGELMFIARGEDIGGS